MNTKSPPNRLHKNIDYGNTDNRYNKEAQALSRLIPCKVGRDEDAHTDWHYRNRFRFVLQCKRIRNITKTQFIETKRRVWQDSLDAVMLNTLGLKVDAEYIVERLLSTNSNFYFFTFADDWLEHATTKGKKNHVCMLNSLEKHLGRKTLSFTSITYKFLSDYEESLHSKPRAQSLYLGEIRHLYREAQGRKKKPDTAKRKPKNKASAPRTDTPSAQFWKSLALTRKKKFGIV